MEPKEAVAPTLRPNELYANLPPINNVYDAFRDLLERILHKEEFSIILDIAVAGGLMMNVATMCSGTEAPIFALKLLQAEFFALTGLELLRTRHLFSVEIEPYKQAYIRRNTDAPVFRDVRDFAVPDLHNIDM